jgi:hypothetical protein
MGSQVSRGIKVELVGKKGKQPAANVDSPIRRDMPGGYTISKDVSGHPKSWMNPQMPALGALLESRIEVRFEMPGPILSSFLG